MFDEAGDNVTVSLDTTPHDQNPIYCHTAVPRPANELDLLLLMTADGDRIAFKQLYSATRDKLYAQAFSILRQREAAEDAIQDSFVRIWVRASAYMPERGSALQWMIKLTRNIIIDRIRRERITLNQCDYNDYAYESPAPVVPVEDRIDLVWALSQLGAPQREAIVAVVVQGWTNEDFGRRLGVPTSTHKARVARGLKRMRAHMTSSNSESVMYADSAGTF